VRRCQYRRDKTCRERTDLKEEQEKIDSELYSYLDEQENKYLDQHTGSGETSTTPNTGNILSSRHSSNIKTDKDLPNNGGNDSENENDDNRTFWYSIRTILHIVNSAKCMIIHINNLLIQLLNKMQCIFKFI